MTVFDRRDEFDASEADLADVASFAHDLYEQDGFADSLEGVIADVVETFAGDKDQDLDEAAIHTLTEWLVTDGLGGLFQLRNQIVTNREADLEAGDIIRMESARTGDDRVIPYVVDDGDPDATGVHVWKVDPDDGDIKSWDHGAGHVLFGERFAVDRSRRGEYPFGVTRDLAAEVKEGDSE